MNLHTRVFDLGLPTPILAIHGNMASSRWWEPMAQVLEAKKLKGSQPLIAADWLGCGESPPPRKLEDLHPEFLAGLYLQLLDDLSMTEKCIVVGHSYGGLIAALATAKAPERFTHSFLINPVTYKGLPVTEEKLSIFRRMKVDREFCAAVLAATIRGQNIDDPFFQKLADDCFRVADLNWEGILQILHDYRGKEPILSIETPTRILHGNRDEVLPIEDSRKQASLMPNCQFIELDEFGHSPNIEDAEKVVQLLFEFCEFAV